MTGTTGTHGTKPHFWVISTVLSLTIMGSVGCSIANDQILPATLEHRISTSNGTADDHIAAALLYQQQAQREKSEAAKYEQTAASIKPIEDPKGFRRSALTTAAQEHRKTAGEMQELYAAHEAKAQTMMGKQQSQ
ncbi:MAG TPA: hypothetical protein VKP13_13320 [Nitrospira sp.]|nr:hypothetical protein [Nitrospira sp.]